MNQKILILTLVSGLILVSGLFLWSMEKIKTSKKPPTTTPTSTPQAEVKKPTKLSQVRVASLYRRVTDGGVIGRDLDDVIEILKETCTDFIFQGWMRFDPCPETCDELPWEERQKCNIKGYSYEHLRNAISEIKREMPDVIFGGGQAMEFLNPECWNPLTGEFFGRDETWAMALDPSKWGINMSKEEFQTKWAVSQGWVEEGQPYNPKEEMPFYFPDVTNPDFQDLFLSWAKKQIDCGVDAYWIDMLFRQARELRRITGDENHPAVVESYNASSEIVDRIHEYGDSIGKHIYVISWAECATFPFPQPELDGVVVTFSSKEVRSLDLDEERWNKMVEIIRGKLGDIPIFAIFDYGLDNSPLAVFSQELSKSQARNFLRIADEFLQEKGIILVYPIHGGNMGVKDVRKLSYGKYNWYDSLAPEFQTYETIRELAREKAAKGMLSHVKDASLQERVTNGKLTNRSVGDVINLLKEAETDLILRSWWIRCPFPESPETASPPDHSSDYVKIQISGRKRLYLSTI